MALDQPGLIGSIYSADVLAEKQQFYPRFFQGIFQEMVRPHLSVDERLALGEIRFNFPMYLPPQEPFGFCSGNGMIKLSIASLKFLNDLLLAYCWLGRHGYKPITIDDYLFMVANWRSYSTPPEPLLSLGIPNDAGREPGTGDLHVDYVKRAYIFILLHELGHQRYHDPSITIISLSESREQESRADQFALKAMGRLGLIPTGIDQFFEWAWAFMPNPADFPDDASYWAHMQERNHPLTTDRLLQVANNIDAAAGEYAVDQKLETLSAFQELSRELRKLASLKRDPDLLRKASRRGRMLKPEDLAPRRPGEMLAVPLGTPAEQRPFQGKLQGVYRYGAVAGDIEVTLQNQSGRIAGAFADRNEIGRIDGVIVENELRFRWVLPEIQGRGLLRFDGTVYEATVGVGDSTTGAAVWSLRPAQLPS